MQSQAYWSCLGRRENASGRLLLVSNMISYHKYNDNSGSGNQEIKLARLNVHRAVNGLNILYLTMSNVLLLIFSQLVAISS